ncbi:hypothetical protein BZG36_05693, partial [Bifiguratus adelaidae]
MERPLLLLHNLPRNGSGGFVDTEHLESSLQFDSVRRLAVIVGASDSGKSRMAIELLCRKAKKCNDPDMVTTNDEYATRYMTSLVLSRLYILKFLLLRSEMLISPYEWAILQLFPLSVGDVFLHVSLNFRRLSTADSLMLMGDWIQDLESITQQAHFPLVIDEAQQLLKTKHVFSSFSDKEGRRPLYTLLIRHLTDNTPFLVIPCGSGLSLKAAEHFAGSNLLETPAKDRLVVVAEQFGTPEAVSKFLAAYQFPVHEVKQLPEDLYRLT